MSLTSRALAFGVVLLLLAISYASSLRVYFNQQRELAELEVQIAQRQQSISELEQELARWNDPAYVRAQARERLGWAVPGEVGYVVVGSDGKPLASGAEVQSSGGEDRSTWWQKLDGSVKAADQPEPVVTPTPTPSPPRTVAPRSPSPSSSPSGSTPSTTTPPR